jgi:hypothetical protein
MDETLIQTETGDDLLLTADSDGGFLTLGINENNIAGYCRYRKKDLTKIFFKQNQYANYINVKETPEEILAMSSLPAIFLNCTQEEEDFYSVVLPVNNMAAYGRNKKNAYTQVHLIQSESDSNFYVKETPEQIRNLKKKAIKGQYNIA